MCVMWITQRREADHHRVGTSTGTAQSAHLSGIWVEIHLKKVRRKSFHNMMNTLAIVVSCSLLNSFHSLVICSTWHFAFPTTTEAFSLMKPVPVTVRRVPSPLDPFCGDINSNRLRQFFRQIVRIQDLRFSKWWILNVFVHILPVLFLYVMTEAWCSNCGLLLTKKIKLL